MNTHHLVRRLSLAGALGMGLWALPAHAATYSVTNVNDSGQGSLRAAIAGANNGAGSDAIYFQDTVRGTIVLTSGELPLGGGITIVGPGAGILTVSGGGKNRVFNVLGGSATISGLTVAQGRAVGASNGGEARGGAILNAGVLSLKSMVFSQNSAVGGDGRSGVNPSDPGGPGGDARGGAIYNAGLLSLSDTRLENNSAVGGNGGYAYSSPRARALGGNAYGGAIFNANGLQLQSTTFANNTVTGGDRAGVGENPDVRDVSPTAQNVTVEGAQNRDLRVQLQGAGDGTLTYSLVSGTLPAGLSLNSATGVISGTLSRTAQSTQVTYKVSDGLRESNTATVTFNIKPVESQSLVVTTTEDVVDDVDNLTSLREAINYANTLSDASTIRFQLPGMGPYSFTLSNTAFPIAQRVTIDGTQSGVPILVGGSQGIFDVAQGARLILINLTLSGGSDSAVAGVVNRGTVNILNSSLSGKGGSLDNEGGVFNLTDSTLSGNGAGIQNSFVSGEGGSSSNTVNIVRCVFTSIADNSFCVNNAGVMNLSNSTYSGNTSSVLNRPSGQMRVQGCTFSGNTTNESLIVNQGIANFLNCTLYGNKAQLGSGDAGGVIRNAGGTELDSCTVTTNNVSPSGAAALGGYGVRVRSSLVVANTGGDVGANTTSGGFVTNSLIGGTAKAAGLQTDSAGKAVLKNNGGLTFTVALLASSPAVGAGQTDLQTDQRGLPRPAGLKPDMGAVEFQGVAPAIFIDSPSVREGNSGTTALTFTLRLSQPSTKAVSVVVNTLQGTAKAGSDYQSVGRGTVTFAPGTTRKTFTVSVVGDTMAEADETFRLDLRSPVNGVLGSQSGTGTILNDDLPAITIDSPSVLEGNSGTTALTFTLTLSQARDEVVSVQVNTLQGTAKAGSDYQSVGRGTVTFVPGVTTQTFTVQVIGDTLVEGNETFRLDLRSPVNAVLGSQSGTGTILNDDGAPRSPSSGNSSGSS